MNGTENQKNPSRNPSDTDHRYADGSSDPVYNAICVYQLLVNNYTVETDRNMHSHIKLDGICESLLH